MRKTSSNIADKFLIEVLNYLNEPLSYGKVQRNNLKNAISECKVAYLHRHWRKTHAY